MAFTAKNAIIKIINGNIGGDDSRYKTLKGLIEAAKANARWGELFNKAKKVKAESYSLRGSYVPDSPILHKQLGWGYILSKKNDRLEVLFQDGIKYLISNYK